MAAFCTGFGAYFVANIFIWFRLREMPGGGVGYDLRFAFDFSRCRGSWADFIVRAVGHILRTRVEEDFRFPDLQRRGTSGTGNCVRPRSPKARDRGHPMVGVERIIETGATWYWA